MAVSSRNDTVLISGNSSMQNRNTMLVYSCCCLHLDANIKYVIKK